VLHNDAGAPPEAGVGLDEGAIPDGSLSATGGTLDLLRFAIVGDTRPAEIDDTAGFPSAIITRIYDDIQLEAAQLVVATGDYIFARPSMNQSNPQFDLYLAARAHYSGILYPALGNHECTSGTASNCGPGAANGMPDNYRAFLNKMLGPLGLTTPYYTVRIEARDRSWSAKFVVVADNAWSDEQASWLEGELAKPSTYTFVVRHEGNNATTAPGVTPSREIMSRHPLTLLLAGHTHTFYYFPQEKEVIVGIGGAPVSGSVNYGYVIGERRPDGIVEFAAHDYATREVFFRFAVQADGTAAP
jgi:hypothetical protein